jgi:hypothetical protein
MTQSLSGMARLVGLFSFFIAGAAASAIAQSFPFAVREIEAGSAVDCSALNTPIGPASRVTVGADGHLAVNGIRTRFFGMNLTDLPQKTDAGALARRLAQLGVNIIRFHHLDAPWVKGLLPGYGNGVSTRKINAEALDRLDFFVAALERNGIYADLNLLTGRLFRSVDGLPKSVDTITESKCAHALGFYRDDAFDLQTEYARSYFGHRNPYTGLTYADDPGVALVELNNENGLMMAYLSGWIDMTPADLRGPLNADWNAWLWKRYASAEQFGRELGLATPVGAELLRGAAQGGVWNLERHEGADATMTEKNGSFTIKVKKVGSESWHVQFNQSRLSLKPNQIYTLSFRARANAKQKLSVSLGMAHDPWAGLGFDKDIGLDTKWQKFEFTFGGATQADDNARLNFSGMGKLIGSFEFADISLREGGSFIKDSAGLKAKKLDLPSFSEYGTLPEAYKRTIMAYLYQKEASYWTRLRACLKNDLGVKSLLMATIVGCTTPGQMAAFDIIDSHAYWNHPVFPHQPWDMGDYYVDNKSLTHDETGGTLSDLAAKRIYGKPFSVSEYDHPYPNQFSAEGYPMLASFAAFQDWDMIFGFCLSAEKFGPDGSVKVDGYFDQNHNPAKAAAFPVAARIFRQALVSPATSAVYVKLDPASDEAALMSARAWSLPDGTAQGLVRETALLHRVGMVWNGAALPAKAMAAGDARQETEAALAAVKAGGAWRADSGEIEWNPQSGVYRVNAKGAFVFAGFAGSDATSPFRAAKGFAVAAGARVDAARWLCFSCAGSGNSAENLREYGKSAAGPVTEGMRITTDKDLGTAPAWALGAAGQLNLPGAKALAVLGSDGKRRDGSKAAAAAGFTLDAGDRALWYEIDF